MAFETFIGSRYLRARQRQAFISLITFLSIAGVAVGVMALIVVLAVMSGFEADLKRHILGGQAHVMLMRYGEAFTDYRETMKKVSTIDGVEAATPYILTQTMLRSANGVTGAVLRGIDPETIGGVLETLADVNLPHSSDATEPGIILGRELAKRIGVLEGDPVYVISPRGMLTMIGHVPAMKRFKVTGFFESGFYEYDQSFAYIHLKDAQRIMRMPDAVSGVEIRVKNIYRARKISEEIQAQLQFPYYTRDWMQMNANLFKALKLERRVMFIILSLIVLVAAFNIASSLIMMVMSKTRDIAILKAMGATDKSIRKIFVFNGMVIGVIGTGLGLGLGLLLCELLKRYDIHELAGDIYYFTTKLPVKLELFNVVAIVAAALLICFLATLYPSRQASKLDPVEAIRYGG
jgi:lipoprotein-releasing system permease protein